MESRRFFTFAFFYALFAFENSSRIALACTSSLNLHPVHRSSFVTLSIENCEWPRNFTYLATKEIPPKCFATLSATNLWTPHSNATLGRENFHKLDYLRTINITGSGIVRVRADAFAELIRAEVINLSRNKLTFIPQNAFQQCKKLRELYVAGNRIETLPDFLFSMNDALSILDLSYNRLEIINSTELFKKTKIKSLHLEGNRITAIYKNTFTELTSLEFLNISYNKMSFPAFANCNGELTSFPENYIWFVDMAVKTNSCVIDFRHNEITGLPLFGIQTSCTPVSNRCKPLTLLLDNNPLSCECEGFDLVRYFRQEWPPNVVQVIRISDQTTCTYSRTGERSLYSSVDIDRIYCTLNTCPNCPSNCSCLLAKNRRTMQVNCSGTRLKEFPRNLPVSRLYTNEFDFSRNRIRSFDGVAYPYLTLALSVSHNRINELPQNFQKFSKLKVLELNDNDLRILSPGQVKHIQSLNLTRLTLGNNPWNCSDCRVLSLVKYLQNSSASVADIENITCFGTGQPVVKIDLDMCKVGSSYFIACLILLISLVTLLPIALFLWYKMRSGNVIKAFKFDDDDGGKASKMYDAFISYAHQDEKYVANLVKWLEQRKNPFKLCLHSRDWMPGEFIIKQMADSVDNSRASIIVLSSAYLRSKWCYSEFRIALTQMLVRRNHKVIAVWLSDEEPNKGNLDPDVRLYINTCTYLKYNDEQFLSKLETALLLC